MTANTTHKLVFLSAGDAVAVRRVRRLSSFSIRELPPVYRDSAGPLQAVFDMVREE